MSNIGFRQIYKWDDANLKQLNDTLRAMWGKVMGRLDIKDLSSGARAVIDSKASGEEMETRFTQTEERIASEASRATGEEGALRTLIQQTAESVTSEASRATGEEGVLRTLIDQNAEDIRIWADSPAKGVDNGSGVVITQAGVSVSGDQYVNIEAGDGSGYLNISPSGVNASSLSAPNVTPMYDGPLLLYVKKNPTEAGLSSGVEYRSLADVSGRLNGTYLNGNVQVMIDGGYTESGNIIFYGMSGAGSLSIYAPAENHAVINAGSLTFRRVTVGVQVRYIDVNVFGQAESGITVDYGSYVEIADCSVSYVGSASSVSGGGYVVTNNGSASISGCAVYGMAAGILSAFLGRIYANANKGNSALYTHHGGTIIANGTQPSPTQSLSYSEDPQGTILLGADVSVDMGGAAPAPSPSVPGTYQASPSVTSTYCNGWAYPNRTGTSLYQGMVNTGARTSKAYGVMWFDDALKTSLAGKTITQATISLFQNSNYGRGVYVYMGLAGTTAPGAGGGEPDIVRDYGIIGRTEPGVYNTLTIPVEAVQDIVNGTIQGLMVVSNDTALYEGRGYSKNYTKYDGTEGGTESRPRLTVTYV